MAVTILERNASPQNSVFWRLNRMLPLHFIPKLTLSIYVHSILAISNALKRLLLRKSLFCVRSLFPTMLATLVLSFNSLPMPTSFLWKLCGLATSLHCKESNRRWLLGVLVKSSLSMQSWATCLTPLFIALPLRNMVLPHFLTLVSIPFLLLASYLALKDPLKFKPLERSLPALLIRTLPSPPKWCQICYLRAACFYFVFALESPHTLKLTFFFYFFVSSSFMK